MEWIDFWLLLMVVLNLLQSPMLRRPLKNIIKCHLSVCKMLKGSSRNIKYLCKGNQPCPHLEEFKVFYNLYLRQTIHKEDDSDDEVEYEDSDELEEGLPEEKVCGIKFLFLN